MKKKEIKTILVSRLHYMSDVIVSIPVLMNLRRAFPDAHIAYLTRHDYTPLLENNPHIDEVIAFHPMHGARRLVADLRARKFDLSIDLLANSSTAMLARVIGARQRVGRRGGLRQFCFTDSFEPQNRKADLVDSLLESLRPIGVPVEKTMPELHLTGQELDWADSYLRSGGIDFEYPTIGIFPGGPRKNRLWPNERYIEFVNELVGRGGWQAVFLQGANEGPMLQRIMDRVHNSIICAEQLPLRRQAALLSKLDLFFGNYSGLTHLAAAVGTRVISLFGPDDSETCFPYDEASGNRAISHRVACRPCNSNYCPLGTLDCLLQISVQEVLAVVERIEFSTKSKDEYEMNRHTKQNPNVK